MKVRVLGCSGAIAKDCRTTSFLIDDNILIDAGTGVGDLTLEEMRKIDHVFLTHSHLDHIAALPLMLDAVSSMRDGPVEIHALAETVEALQAHVFNNVIWPDFSAIPSVTQPFIRYDAIEVGQQINIDGTIIEPLPAVHTVPAVGFAVRGDKGWWIFSGDTGRNPALWARIKALPVEMLVIETAFSDQESALALRSLHLSPRSLLAELRSCIRSNYSVYITHTKPAETQTIIHEVHSLFARNRDAHALTTSPLDIQLLQAGQEFTI